MFNTVVSSKFLFPQNWGRDGWDLPPWLPRQPLYLDCDTLPGENTTTSFFAIHHSPYPNHKSNPLSVQVQSQHQIRDLSKKNLVYSIVRHPYERYQQTLSFTSHNKSFKLGLFLPMRTKCSIKTQESTVSLSRFMGSPVSPSLLTWSWREGEVRAAQSILVCH